MTISECINWVSQHPNPVIIYMITVPAIAFILSMFFDETGHQSPGKYLFSILIYATALPGVLAIILSGYDFLFLRTDLKNVNILVYFLPILSMGFTLAIINRVVNMTQIPGFKRLSGLMIIIAVTSIIVFILQRLFIGVVFFGSVYMFLGMFVILFVIIK
ncbi:MAG: hypothetical protein R2728_14445, partial [Chitinophagales bacterium]